MDSMAGFVPIVSSPGEVYPETARAAQTQRWEHLEARFQELYGRKADFISRSPGRVNIIGEVNPITRKLKFVPRADSKF